MSKDVDFAAELDAIAREAKVGTEHEAHEDWEWKYPDRRLVCGCGAVLVDPDGAVI